MLKRLKKKNPFMLKCHLIGVLFYISFTVTSSNLASWMAIRDSCGVSFKDGGIAPW